MAGSTAKIWMAVAGLLLVGLAPACKDKGTDSGVPGPDLGPEPWVDLAPVALDPFRALLRTDLPDAVTPSRLVSLPRAPLTFVVDREAGHAWGLDQRYRHDPASVCVDIALWPDLDPDGERQGLCLPEHVQVDRGSLDPGSSLVALAVDEADPGIWMLGRNGALAWANADPLEDNPMDFLRPVQAQEQDLGDGPWALAVRATGGLWLADGTGLLQLDADGAALASTELDAAVVDLVATNAGAWILTATGLWTWDGESLDQQAAFDGSGGQLDVDGDVVWATAPATGQLRSSDGAELTVDGLSGPLAAHDDTLWLALDGDELLRLDGGVETDRQAVDPVTDLLLQDTGELVLLHDDHTVAVVVDETGLEGPAPLNASIVTFLENPKPDPDDTSAECADANTMDLLLSQAGDNRRLLEDLPVGIGLGIISEAARQALLCAEQERFLENLDLPRLGAGLLVWDQTSDDLTTEAAVSDFLLSQAAPLKALGVDIGWIGAVPRLGEQGADWVQAVDQADIADDVLFFGMDLFPEVGSFDPRAKDPVPWNAADAPTAWRPASGGDPLVEDPDGPLLMRPGWTLSLYSMGGCANVFLFECKQSGLGGNTTIDDGDLQVMDLLLWRALAARSDDGPDHWYVHLPDISKFDYTDGCHRQERLWLAQEDQDCQAERLQQWTFDVHARYQQAGLLDWWVP